jgi:hypothetical protein
MLNYATMRSVYKCRICKQPKKNHVCNKPNDDDEYETHCQICFLEYSSDNIKTGPMKDKSCHSCCESCFTKMIKKGRDGKENYKCPWCRKDYAISDNISSQNFIDDDRFVLRMLQRVRYNKRMKQIQERELKKKELIRIQKQKENIIKLIIYVLLGFITMYI